MSALTSPSGWGTIELSNPRQRKMNGHRENTHNDDKHMKNEPPTSGGGKAVAGVQAGYAIEKIDDFIEDPRWPTDNPLQQIRWRPEFWIGEVFDVPFDGVRYTDRKVRDYEDCRR